jgi:hypothetical protein
MYSIMWQQLIVGLMFAMAAIYLFRLFRNAFKADEEGCAAGCSTCGTPSHIEQMARQKQHSGPGQTHLQSPSHG